MEPEQERTTRPAPVADEEGARSPHLPTSDVAALIRGKDWSKTPLGPANEWSDSLRMALDLIQTSGFPMALRWGPEFVLLYNDGYVPILGDKHPHALGLPFREAWPEVMDTLLPLHEELLSGKRSAYFSEDLPLTINRHGSATEVARFTISYGPVRDATTPTGIGGVLVVVVETTERVAMLRKLQATEESFQLALDAAGGVGTWNWDMDRDVVYADARFASLFGIDIALAARGAPIGEFLRAIDERDLARVGAAIQHTVDTGAPFAEEHRLRQPDGHSVWVFAKGGIQAPRADRSRRFAGVVVDITARKRIEADLAEARERLAFSVDAADIGTFHCPMPLNTIEWNATCKAHFWLPPDAVVDFDLFYSIMHPEDRDQVRNAVAQAIDHRQLYDVEYRTVSPAGEIRWIRAKGRVYFREDGSPMRFDGITIDISSTKQAQADHAFLLASERAARSELERASHHKDEFLSTLSHELRTPLSAIVGWVYLLRNGASDPSIVLRGVDVIERSANQQTRLIEDLLDLSRIMAGKVRLDVQPVIPADVILATLDTIKPSAEAKEIRISMALDPVAGPVAGDPNRLQQVLWNLLTNAIKFTPKGGTIRILLERVNSHVEISISDSGIGIAPEFLPHVFERFRQHDSSTSRSHGGLGIGLAIVKHLIELHGGEVRAKSKGLEQGATFIVSLPVRATARDPQEQHPGLSPASAQTIVHASDTLSGIDALVVDDEADARDVVERILSHVGAKVRVAASANQADAVLANCVPDIIISDLGMSPRDGFDFIRNARARGAEMPAVALTAFARTEDRLAALHAGYQAHLSKPVVPAELIAIVASLTRQVARLKSK